MTIELNGVPLAAIEASTAVTVKAANEAIAERVQTIRNALGEIRQITRATGVTVSLQDLVYEVQNADSETDWNSSSAYC